MGAVSDAIEAAARGFGAEVRTERPGRPGCCVEGGEADGVVLANGEEICGPRSSSPRCTRAPRSSTTSAAENLPADFVRDIENWKTRSGVVKINLALAELPDFTADPGTEPAGAPHRLGRDGADRWSTSSGRSRTRARASPALRPFSDGVIPTTFDKTLCPEGTHIMSLFTQWVPSDWSEEPHTEELEAYADRMIDCYNEVAPNFKGSILHRDVVGPYEMEHEYGLIGGNIFHGELSLEQLFHMRPAPGYADYRTPVKGLYYASSATHAGGGVCGIPGWQAARAAIADKKAARRAGRRARSSGGHDQRPEQLQADDRPSPPGSPDRPTWPVLRDAGGAQRRGGRRPPRPGSFGERMVAEVGRSPAAPRRLPGESRGTTRSAAGAATRRSPTCPSRSTWCCSACPTPRSRSSSSLAARPRRPVGGDLRQRLRARRPRRAGLRDAAGRDRARPGWRCAGPAAWASSTSPTGCARSATSSRTRCPAGPVALVTHSGSVFSAMLRSPPGARLHARGVLRPGAGDHGGGLPAPTRSSCRRPGCSRWSWRRSASRRCCGRCSPRRPTADVPVVLLTAGASAAGRAMVAAHSGALAGRDGGWEALARRLRRAPGRRPGRAGRHPGAVRHRAGPRARPRRRRPRGHGIATVHDSGLERAHIADVADELGVPFAAIGDRHTKRLAGRLLDPGLRAGQPARRLGDRPRRRAAVRRVAGRAGRRPGGGGGRARGRPGHRVRRRPVLPAARCSMPRPRTGKPLAVLANLPGRHRPGGGGAAARAGVPVLEGTRTGLLALRHLLDQQAARTRDAAAAARRPTPAPARGRWRDGAARRWPGARPRRRPARPAPRLRDTGGAGRAAATDEAALAAAGRDRLPGRAQDRRARHRAQVRRRRRAARRRATRPRWPPPTPTWPPGSARGCSSAQTAPPGTELAARHRPRPRARAADRGRRRRRAGRAAGRPGGRAAAGGRLPGARGCSRRLRVAAAAGRGPRRSRRPTWRGGRGDHRRCPRSPASSATQLEALDINPLICGPAGAVAVDALVIPRAARR